MHVLVGVKEYGFFFYYTLFLPEARCVCRQAAVKAAKILPLDGLARSKQDPINRVHGAQYDTAPRQPGLEYGMHSCIIRIHCLHSMHSGHSCLAFLVTKYEKWCSTCKL